MQWKILIEGKSLCRFYLVLLMIGLSVVIALLIYVLLQCKNVFNYSSDHLYFMSTTFNMTNLKFV